VTCLLASLNDTYSNLPAVVIITLTVAAMIFAAILVAACTARPLASWMLAALSASAVVVASRWILLQYWLPGCTGLVHPGYLQHIVFVVMADGGKTGC